MYTYNSHLAPWHANTHGYTAFVLRQARSAPTRRMNPLICQYGIQHGVHTSCIHYTAGAIFSSPCSIVGSQVLKRNFRCCRQFSANSLLRLWWQLVAKQPKILQPGEASKYIRWQRCEMVFIKPKIF